MSAGLIEDIEYYLTQETIKKGKDCIYISTGKISREAGLSTKQVGYAMGVMMDNGSKFGIEKWAKTSDTTWKIETK